MPDPAKCKKKNKKGIIRRFSRIENEKFLPFFELYNPLCDPVMKQEKRKMKPAEMPFKKPKLKHKCVVCKDKKEKTIEDEEKKIEKYVKPISKKEKKKIEDRHYKEQARYYVCKKEIVRLPSPLGLTTVADEREYESATKPPAGKVIPQKMSYTDNIPRYPAVPSKADLKLKAPKSQIFINKSKKSTESDKRYPPVDSIDYIYDVKYRKMHPWYKMFRGADTISLVPVAPAPSTAEEELERIEKVEVQMRSETVTEEVFGEDETFMFEIEVETKGDDVTHVSRHGTVDPADTADLENMKYKTESYIKSGKKTLPHSGSSLEIADDDDDDDDDDYQMFYEDEIGEEEASEISLVHGISKYSAATSICSEYKIKYPSDELYDITSLVPSAINKILQKYQRESEMELLKKIREPFQRGTIKSHSTTKIPHKPVSFFFGVKAATMHYGDPTFSEKSRYRQGLTICVMAYIFSFIKHPTKWTPRDIDKVLDFGDKLFLKSLDTLHLHDSPRILQPEEVCKIVSIADKKIKYHIQEPDIAGFIRSEDHKVFNLLKGLTLFFKKHRAGILQSYNTNILIWKQKHFYVFDPEPRTQELYSNETGTTTVSNFYDIPSVAKMLLERGKLENWPFVIMKICIKKIVSSHGDGASLTSDYREESLYKIVDPGKATVRATFSIADNCFGNAKNRIGLTVSLMAAVYSHITPACAWHRRTLDKILMVANQFYHMCLEAHHVEKLKLEHIPAFFTVGPLMIEIAIYACQYAGLMYRKSICLFEELLKKFFHTNSTAIVQIDKYVLAIWRDRNFYYTFDPYPRNHEGIKMKYGTACVNMNTSIENVCKTICTNFNVRDYIFKIHILKIIRIHRDPEFGKLPRSFLDSEESIIDALKMGDKKNYKPQNITIDITESAMKTTHYEDPLDPSNFSVGSFVGSLSRKYVPLLPVCLPKQTKEPVKPEKIIDLDAPSLSDTQIERDPPSPLRQDSFEFYLLDEITKEEMNLMRVMEVGEGGGFYDYMEIANEYIEEYSVEMKDEIIQKGRDYDLGRTTTKINTDLLGLYIYPRIVLEPNKVPISSKQGSREKKTVVVAEPVVTQSQELARPNNFLVLPDGSEILYGTKNIAQLGENYEEATPFASVLAVVFAKKYSLYTWTTEVVDACLDYGCALKKNINIKFDDFPKIQIPKLTIGSAAYSIAIDYLFDSLVEPTILKASLEKLIFRNRESCVVVTQAYSVAVFYKRTLYYMYDGFGCNLVGLGEGLDNSGVACLFRFKNISALVSRFMYNKQQRENIEPTESSRFVLSKVEITSIVIDYAEQMPRIEKQLPRSKNDQAQFETNPKEADQESNKSRETKRKNLVGYHSHGKYYTIEGSTGLTGRNEGNGIIKECHFVCVCAMIGIFGKPIKIWDRKRVNYVIRLGRTLFGYLDNVNFADRRNIKNLLFDKYFFDIIIKRIDILNPKNRRNILIAMRILLTKNKFLIIQFPNSCYVLYKGTKLLHLFDPYGTADDSNSAKSCWIKFKDLNHVKRYLKSKNKETIDTFFFYTLNISKMKKASKRNRFQYKIRVTQVKKTKKPKQPLVFNEDEEWCTDYPIPWSLMKKNLACGVLRGTQSHKWYNWEVEYPQDLYSLVSTIHQTSNEFPGPYRGKQTIANCIVAIVMTEIYDFTEWNPLVLDSILRSGSQYFTDCVKNITEKNYEIKVEDFKNEVTVFPYTVIVDIYPVVEGTMYLVRFDQFNISKALQYFFRTHENRCGIICANNGRSRPKYVAFGRIREGEYFMFDCQSIGPPMFVDRFRSRAYILRCLTLNRLVHCITVTLRSGDFYIWHVGIAESQEQVQRVTDYESELADQIE